MLPNDPCSKRCSNITIGTTNSFEADLPEMDPEQFSKLYTWGQNACVKFDLRTDDDMTMTLAATRKKSDTARGHQRLLRTNLINWGVVLPNKQMGWLRLQSDVHADSQDSVATLARSASGPKDSTPRPQFQNGLRLPENLLTVLIASH